MPDPRKKKPCYSEKQATRWLSWLARGMQQHGQTVFLIEQLQPSWLSSRRQRYAYGVASRLAAGIPLGVIVGVIVTLILVFLDLESTVQRLRQPGRIPSEILLMAGFALVIAVVPGLVLGSGAAILDLLRLRGNRVLTLPERFGERWRSTVFVVGYQGGLTLLSYTILACVGGLLALGWSLTGKETSVLYFLLIVTAVMAFLAPFAALIGSVIWGNRAARQSQGSDISTVETLGWSWAAARKGVLPGLVHGSGSLLLSCLCPILFPLMLLTGATGAGFGLVIGLLPRVSVRKAVWGFGKVGLRGGLLVGLGLVLVAAVILSFIEPWTAVILVGVVVLCGICGGAIGGIFNGLQSKVVAIKTRPNQGMRLSLKNALAGGGLVAVPFGLAGGVAGLSAGLWPTTAMGNAGIYATFFALSAALVAGLFGSLWYGGVDWIYHFVLRLILGLRHALPFRLSRFLDYAADELHFLQKVGGGYMFIHRYLLEHFATLEEPAAGEPEKAAEPAAALAAAS
jgi:hypothetical protein